MPFVILFTLSFGKCISLKKKYADIEFNFYVNSMMKLLFAISLMSVCLLLVMARFVRFVHRQETIEEDSVRDDLGLSSSLKMQMQKMSSG